MGIMGLSTFCVGLLPSFASIGVAAPIILVGLRKRAASGEHDFGRLCADLDIEHRLAPPMHPQTNGMVERFNGRIEEVLGSHHSVSGNDLETTLLRYVHLYNTQLPQSALRSRTPMQTMKDWHSQKPELFKKQPYLLAGCDKCSIPDDHISPRRSAFFMARSVLRDIRKGVRPRRAARCRALDGARHSSSGFYSGAGRFRRSREHPGKRITGSPKRR